MAGVPYPGNNAGWMADGTPRCNQRELRSFRGNFWDGYPFQPPPKVPCQIQKGYQQPGDQSPSISPSLFHPTWQCLTSPEDKLSHWSINFQNLEWQSPPQNFNTCVWTEKWNPIFGRRSVQFGSWIRPWGLTISFTSRLHTTDFPINRFETAGPLYIQYITSIQI